MRGFGEIRRLCDVARPSIGVVTAVGRLAHRTRRRHRRRGAGEARVGRGVAGRRHRGAQRRRRTRRRDARSHVGLVADVRDEHRRPTCGPTTIELDELARARFTVRSPWGTVPVRLAVSGRHMVLNATAALRGRGRARRPARRRGRCTCNDPHLGDAHGHSPRTIGRDRDQRRLQRQPDVDARRTRVARRVARRPPRGDPRRDGRARRSRGRTRGGGSARRSARDRAGRRRHRSVRRAADRRSGRRASASCQRGMRYS